MSCQGSLSFPTRTTAQPSAKTRTGSSGQASRLARALTLSSLPVVFVALALPAIGDPIEVELGPVTVTATKTSRPLDEVPESVSIIDRNEIEQRQPQTLGDLVADLPNVAIGGGPRAVGQTLTIRGLSDDRILFLLDGARQNFARGHNARLFVEPDLLRRVEVIRGPASALWGSGAIGGVIALETVDASDLLAPGQTLGGRVRAGYQGVNSQWMTGAAAYGRLDDQLDLLIDLNHREAGDTRLGDGEDLAHSGYERTSGLAKSSWSPDGITWFSASYLGLREDGDVPSNAQTLATPENLVDRLTRQDNLNFRFRHDHPDNPYFSPSLVLYRNQTRIDEERQQDARRDETELTTIGLDLRNTMRLSFGGQIDQILSYGLEYYEDRASAERDGAPRSSSPDGRQQIISAYLQDEILIGERLTLIPGIRFDDYSSQADQQAGNRNEDSAWSAKLGANLRVTDWLALQASYNEAFRAPTPSELFVSGVHFTCGPGCQNLFVPNPDLKPEKAHNKEIGLRLSQRDLFTEDDRAGLRAAFFRNDVRDFIDREVIFSPRPMPGNPGPGGVSTSENVTDARLEGFEIEALYDAPRWFAGLAYSQTRGDDENTDEPLASVQPDEWIARLGLRFPAQGLEIGARGRFIAAQERVPEGVEPSEEYDLYDLWLTWRPAERLAGLSLDLGIDNLLDEDYTPYLSVLQGPGRNIKATLSYRF
ncbi:TonB-dependent receptor [Halochromatium glycolicum]|uniref:TonB-dependent receptor n=1 Tax=Halochromatium glycolicum TaxID=85075 RepID=A0AAJ0XAQ4_9GAMM|nr:TonB-dependent receptor [Halochromatium glycolicum]